MCGYDNNQLEVNLKSYHHGYVARFHPIAERRQFLEFDERPHQDCCFIGDLCNVFYTYRLPITQGGNYQAIDIGKTHAQSNHLNYTAVDACIDIHMCRYEMSPSGDYLNFALRTGTVLQHMKTDMLVLTLSDSGRQEVPHLPSTL